ncbi:MAG TPA: WYL domain-containing protein [Synergistaceae bacterium]|nr:WYL domain-containing protein [Synergistaceae bacterium]
MPKAQTDITHERLHRLIEALLSSCPRPFGGPPFLKVSDLDEICDIPHIERDGDEEGDEDGAERNSCEEEEEKKLQNRIYKKRARYIKKLREKHNIDLRYERAGERYVLENIFSFSIHTDVEISHHILETLGASQGLLEHIFPHLAPHAGTLLQDMGNLLRLQIHEKGHHEAASFCESLPSVHGEQNHENLPLIAEALREKRTISFLYSLPGEKEEGGMEETAYSPWEIYFACNGCYVWGVSSGETKGESFKMCRMKNIQLGTTEGYRESTLDQETEQISRPLWTHLRKKPQFKVILSFQPPRAGEIAELHWPDYVNIRLIENGEVLFETTTPDLEEIASFVLSHLPWVKVVQPKELQGIVMNRIFNTAEVKTAVRREIDREVGMAREEEREKQIANTSDSDLDLNR